MKEILRQSLYIPFYNLLIFFTWLSGGSVGWAIILLTVLIRVALLPSSLKAARASAKMQNLTPKMNEIRNKHKGDQKKQNEELMKLYKEEGTSPFGACLPILIQLPIIMILYRVFMVGLDTSRYSILYSFTPRPETLNIMFLGFDLSKPDLWILPIIAGVTQLILSWMSMPPVAKNKDGKTDPTQMMSRQMMYFLPLITVFIGRSLPSALVIYWIVTTLFSIGQQYYVNKTIKKNKIEPKLVEIEEENEKPVENDNVKKITDKKPTRASVMTNMMKKRLDKQDKKKGVEITIRSKE